MPGQVLKNLLIVLAPDVMEVGQVKPFHTTNPKGSVRIANIATPHEKAVVNQANVNTPVLALFILAKTKVGESHQLLLETWFLSVLMPVDWISCFTKVVHLCQALIAITIL